MRKHQALSVGVFVVLLCASVRAQKPRTLLVERPLGNDPIRIVKVVEGTAELTGDGNHFPNRHAWESVFSAGDDWIRDLSFVIRNVSNKNITYVAVSCVLSETADWQAEIAKHKTIGNPILGQASHEVGWRPEHALYSTLAGKQREPDSTRRPAFTLGPKQEFSISLEDPEKYESLRSSVEARTLMSNINACNGQVSAAFFEDGTMWQDHHYRRAAEEPGKWTTISFEDWAQTKQ